MADLGFDEVLTDHVRYQITIRLAILDNVFECDSVH